MHLPYGVSQEVSEIESTLASVADKEEWCICLTKCPKRCQRLRARSVGGDPNTDLDDEREKKKEREREREPKQKADLLCSTAQCTMSHVTILL